MLGIATKAMTTGEFITLLITTIPFRPGCAPQRKIMSVECIQISQRKECGKIAAKPARTGVSAPHKQGRQIDFLGLDV